jgi:hypothetical protein
MNFVYFCYSSSKQQRTDDRILALDDLLCVLEISSLEADKGQLWQGSDCHCGVVQYGGARKKEQGLLRKL